MIRSAPRERSVRIRALGLRCLGAVRIALVERLPRLFLLAGVSIALGALILVVKFVLFITAPDWFLLANILFGVGALTTKFLLLRRRREVRRMDAPAAGLAERLAYSHTGVTIVALSGTYLLSLTPALVGADTFHAQDLWAAISIAVIAFTELALSLVSAIAGRRDSEPLASALRRTNLATAIVLMSLAQAALISTAATDGFAASAFASVGFGLGAAAVGLDMLWRSRRFDKWGEPPAEQPLA